MGVTRETFFEETFSYIKKKKLITPDMTVFYKKNSVSAEREREKGEKSKKGIERGVLVLLMPVRLKGYTLHFIYTRSTWLD